MNKKQITYWLSVIVIGIALGLGLQFVRAWTEPTTAPPNGNVGAPINTSANPQTKTGGITAGTLTAAMVTGTTQLCIGTDCRTAWPSGETTSTVQMYQCVNFRGMGNVCDTNCFGQVQVNSTCWVTTSENCATSDVPCTPL